MGRALVIQHVEPERPCAIATALREAGIDVELAPIHAGHELPDDLDGYAGLVVMGGPMSAVDDGSFPTRRAEIALLRRAIESGLPTLGVCLGAQLLAAAGGSAVYPGPAGPEVGWGTVELAPGAATDALLGGLGPELTVLHWHGDTFDLPSGATRLASNDSYPNQAFRLGDRAWGLQFHLEVDLVAVSAFVAVFAAEAEAAGTDPASILDRAPGAVDHSAPARRAVTSRFAALVANASEP